MDINVEGLRPIKGSFRVTPDKSISHRAVLIGLLANGTSVIRNLNPGNDLKATLNLAKKFGAEIIGECKKSELRITGGTIAEKKREINCQNSGTTMRLGAGIAATIKSETHFIGDDSLSARPMERIQIPLELMGAKFTFENDKKTAPFTIRGANLKGISYKPEVNSAQIKGAILFGGLKADSITRITEQIATRMHTEELLLKAGAQISWVKEGDGLTVSLVPGELHPIELEIPGDPSSAAYYIISAIITPDSSVEIKGIYGGLERCIWVKKLREMGAEIIFDEKSGHIEGKTSELCALKIEGSEVPHLIDEIPILSVAAAFAEGTSILKGLSELRHKESDRLNSTLTMLKSFGAAAEIEGDNLIIKGRGSYMPAVIDSCGDHRIAMAGLVMARAISGSSKVKGCEWISISDPQFLDEFFK
jgi:3-phosphoshikimate 1-carboxyvinyltransferase